MKSFPPDTVSGTELADALKLDEAELQDMAARCALRIELPMP
jgi:hypothetical protein